MLGGELGVDAQHLERPSGMASLTSRDREPAEVVDMVQGTMLEPHVPRSVEQHVDNRSFGRCEQHRIDERLALVATAVTTDQLRARAANGEVEDARVRRVDEIEAHDLPLSGLAGELGLAVDQQDVAETPHGGEGRPGPAEVRNVAALDEQVV